MVEIMCSKYKTNDSSSLLFEDMLKQSIINHEMLEITTPKLIDIYIDVWGISLVKCDKELVIEVREQNTVKAFSN